MSFIEVTESQRVTSDAPVSKEANGHPRDAVSEERSQPDPLLSWQAQRAEALFSILSSYSDVDHPICTECTNLLLEAFAERLASTNRERDAYASFLRALQAEDKLADGKSDAELEREFEETLDKEKATFEQLEAAEEERRDLEVELEKLEEESKALARDEEDFWASRNILNEQLHELNTEAASLQARYAQDQLQLERLQRTNVFNDTFCIGHDGNFVTINGLRLGRLPNKHVEWGEINAALGQALLLLTTLAERLSFEFNGYRLRPLGSTSRIEKIEWPQQGPVPNSQSTTTPFPQKATPKITPFDLFSSGEIPLGRMFYHKRFDAGMVAFLDCLNQLGSRLETISSAKGSSHARAPASQRSEQVLPYQIEGDKIGDMKSGQMYSIKLGVGLQQDETWTKALKYAMTCLKYIQAYVSNMLSGRESR